MLQAPRPSAPALTTLHRWRKYAILASARNAVGLQGFFVYWQEGSKGTPHRKIFGPVGSYQRALDLMHNHQKEIDMSIREVEPREEFEWNGTHEAIIFLQGRDFEMLAKGWAKPRPTYVLDNKERSALRYLDEHGLGGIEQKV